MTGARVRLTDYDAAGQTPQADLDVLSAPLSETLTLELDGAASALGIGAEEIVLASLGRAIERTIGGGTVTVDVTRPTTAVHNVTLTCAGPTALSADEMLSGVHHGLAAQSQRRAVHGHGYAESNRHDAHSVADVLFVPDGHDAGPTGHGHRLEVHGHRRDGVLVLDWWFDTRRFEPYSVEELAEQLPHALIELTSEAAAPLGAGAVLAMAF